MPFSENAHFSFQRTISSTRHLFCAQYIFNPRLTLPSQHDSAEELVLGSYHDNKKEKIYECGSYTHHLQI